MQRVIAQTYVDHHGFQVYTESSYPKGLDAAHAARIGRYLGHPPLATSHLAAYDGQQVTYWYIDTATKVKQTVTCSALDLISRLIPHTRSVPKRMQLVRYAGLYGHSIKRQCAELGHTALEALQTQLPLFARRFAESPNCCERRAACPTPSGAADASASDASHLVVPCLPRRGDGQGQASFGFDPRACPRCVGSCNSLKSSNLRFAEPKRGHVWMRRWRRCASAQPTETHRAIKALREAFADLHQRPLDRHHQLGLGLPTSLEPDQAGPVSCSLGGPSRGVFTLSCFGFRKSGMAFPHRYCHRSCQSHTLSRHIR